MKLRRAHFFHSSVVLAVLVQLAFAGAFLADAVMTNGTYDALAAHRVAVTGQGDCYYLVRPSRGGNIGPPNVCQVAYSYQGHTYSALIAASAPKIFYIDPRDPQYRMNEAAFAKGPVEITGDVVIAVLLLCGATAVTVAHQLHLRRRRHARRARPPEPAEPAT